MGELEKRVDNIITAGLLDGEDYDDVKEYILSLERENAELKRYKNRYDNIIYAIRSGDDELIKIMIDSFKGDGVERFENQLKALRGY